MTFIEEELNKAEEALCNERNTTQQTFYEGYIKGLKYGKEALEAQKNKIIEEIENFWHYIDGNDDQKNYIIGRIKQI